MRVVAIIPARGGSKGIPKKNITEVFGKPLIHWTLEAAIHSKYIMDVVVSSDDDEILASVKKFKDVTLIERPKELAKDSSPTEPVLVHALKKLQQEFDYMVLLQPTSPLRTAKDIDKAFEKLIHSNATSLISVSVPEHHPLKSFTLDKNGYLKGLVNNQFPFMPRQELPETFQSNGAIYIVKVSEFLKNKTLFTEKTIHFVMPSEKSTDVDSLKDVKKIEHQLKI